MHQGKASFNGKATLQNMFVLYSKMYITLLKYVFTILKNVFSFIKKCIYYIQKCFNFIKKMYLYSKMFLTLAQVRMTECLIVFVKLWGASSQLILSLSFVLWVISTVTTQSGWGHASLMPMVWLFLISPLLLTVLNWLMVPLIELEVCWILFWLMFRICVMCMFMVMLVGRTMRRLELHWICHLLLLDLM